MSEKPQFDIKLGGESALPRNYDVIAFAAMRAKEVQIMNNALELQSGTKLAFQRLPKHMRRRTMAHKVKRLPRKVRQLHLQQMQKSGMPPKAKRPLRKHRRRPRNLLDDYYRRQQRVKWLKTHIWHAKRFYMVEKWGYKLPYCSFSKSFKACYRASAQHCLIQDISYFNCLELYGNKNSILENLKKVTEAEPGHGIGAKAFISGNREGCTTFYDTFRKPLGSVYFLWMPASQNSLQEITKLWLWSHVSYIKQIENCLINIFNLVENTEEEVYTNSEGLQLKLRQDLCRFRLTGPLANSTVYETTKIAPINSEFWLNKYLNKNKPSYENQIKFWDLLSSTSTTSNLSPHRVLGVVLQDPRYHIPKTRTKASNLGDSLINDMEIKEVANSPLWEDSFREVIRETRKTNHDIIKERENLLVPGTTIEKNIPIVPIILIQIPGNKNENLGFGSGWDIILASEWAQPVWISLIMRGARSGGLREFESLNYEMGQMDFLMIDTEAGENDEKHKSMEYKEHYFRKPPNKRINFSKLGIVSPLDWNWRLLLKDWTTNSLPIDRFTVIRKKSILTAIQDFIQSKSKSIPVCDENCLIPVKIKAVKRGVPKSFAIICIPKENDLKIEPTEPNHIDQNQKERNNMRRQHKVLLKKLRRFRVRSLKKKNKRIYADTRILEEFKSKMRQLWLPEPINIRNSCAREVIGFVKNGGFSFSSGISKAVGYIAFGCLKELHFGNKVLFRNINSKQYRLATLDVII